MPPLESLVLMEPGQGTAPFTSADWAFALPTPGYRMLAAFGAGVSAAQARPGSLAPGCRLRSRRGVDATRWFPEVAQALASLGQSGPTVVDGEICVLDAHGRSDLQLLHERALFPGPRPGASAVLLCLRDLLVWEGRDVRALPWIERRRLLAALPLREAPALRQLHTVTGEGQWLARQAWALGHVAIHAFRCDAPYVAGPSIGWLSIPVASDCSLTA